MKPKKPGSEKKLRGEGAATVEGSGMWMALVGIFQSFPKARRLHGDVGEGFREHNGNHLCQ